MSKPSILWWSVVPWAKTGYGKVTYNICKRLQRDFDVSILAYTGLQFGSIEWEGLRVYPPLSIYDDYAVRSVHYYYYRLKPDLIIQHFDLWVVRGDIRVPFVAYTPIDQEPLSPLLVRHLRNAIGILAMTRYAQRILRAEGFDSIYMPHGVDTSIYRPMDKMRCREYFGLPKDVFIFLFVGANHGPRKNIPALLKAFALFVKQERISPDECILLLHTYVHKDAHNPVGYELPYIWHYLGIAGYVKHTAPMEYLMGLTEEEMAMLYNCADVFVLPSCGEGFGLPILEAMACGVPVIGTEFSAIPEIIGDAGLTVRIAEYICWDRTLAWAAVIDTEDLAEKLAKLYYDEKLRKQLGRKGVKRAALYDWDRVVERFLKPALHMWLGERKCPGGLL